MDKRAYAGLEVVVELEEQILALLQVWKQHSKEYYGKDGPLMLEAIDSVVTLSMRKMAFAAAGWVSAASA